MKIMQKKKREGSRNIHTVEVTLLPGNYARAAPTVLGKTSEHSTLPVGR
jgi:hypothetical protein